MTTPQQSEDGRARLARRLRKLERTNEDLSRRIKTLEEEVQEARQVGLQVAHLGDLVAGLLARRSREDAGFEAQLKSYTDEL